MRHKVKKDSLSRFSSYRRATLKSLVSALLWHKSIITTEAKARSTKRVAEKVITLAKKGTLSAKRRAFAFLGDHRLVKALFEKVAPSFDKRHGGYTRLIKYRNRRGDNAQLVILEFTEDYDITGKDSKLTKAEKIKDKVSPDKKSQVKDQSSKESLQEAEFKEIDAEVAAEAPHAHPEEKHKHAASEEDKKNKKKLFGGFKGLFKRERDAL